MKEFIVVTNNEGMTSETLSPDNQELRISMEAELGNPKNASIVVQCHILEGYRPVMAEEKEKYPKPDCALWWNDEHNKFDTVDKFNWGEQSKYFVPVDFKFEAPKKELTNEDAKNHPLVRAWNGNHQNEITGELIGVGTDRHNKYALLDSSRRIFIREHAELITEK